MGTWLETDGVADAGAYLARLVRLDAAALVRLRPAGDGALALWARLPFEVMVTRRIRSSFDQDATVRAIDLLRALDGDLPARYDAQWRWPVPPDAGRVVERLPVAEVRRLGTAAETALRTAITSGVHGRAVGERVLRDALLDHVPVVVITDDGARYEVLQRLVQAVIRMGFLGPVSGAGSGSTEDGDVDVRAAPGGWVGLAGPFGTGWYKTPTGLGLRPVR